MWCSICCISCREESVIIYRWWWFGAGCHLFIPAVREGWCGRRTGRRNAEFIQEILVDLEGAFIVAHSSRIVMNRCVIIVEGVDAIVIVVFFPWSFLLGIKIEAIHLVNDGIYFIRSHVVGGRVRCASGIFIKYVKWRYFTLVGYYCFAAVLQAKTGGSWMGNQVQFGVIVGG